MFVDLHQHIIHGMDDGASSFAETAAMLRAAHEDGVAHIFATPHIFPGRRPFDFERYARNLQAARSFCTKERIPIELHAGSEIMYTDETVRLLGEGRVPTLGGTPFVLVEFPSNAPLDALMRAGRALNNAGYVSIYAHIERYSCLRSRRNATRLRALPDVRLQVNAATMVRKNAFLENFFLHRLFSEGLIDYIASDAHGMRSRRTAMRECARVLEKRYGRTYAEALMFRNQIEVLYAVREG